MTIEWHSVLILNISGLFGRWVKVDEKELEWTAVLVFILYVGNVSDRKSKIFEVLSNKFRGCCGV